MWLTSDAHSWAVWLTSGNVTCFILSWSWFVWRSFDKEPAITNISLPSTKPAPTSSLAIPSTVSAPCINSKRISFSSLLPFLKHAGIFNKETGYLSIKTELKIKVITFWVNLLTGRRDKFSFKIYLICLSLYRRGLIIFKWLDHVVNILNETGFSFVFIEQLNFDAKYFKNILLPQIKKVVRDQAKQALTEKIRNECSFVQYPSIYTHHCVQLYLQKCPLISGSPW